MGHVRPCPNGRPSPFGFGNSLLPVSHTVFFQLPRVPAMASTSQGQEGGGGVPSTLYSGVIHLSENTCGILPARTAFGCASALLTTIRDSTVERQGYIELGVSCADVCKALDRGLSRRRSDELTQSVLEAIDQFTTTVAVVQQRIAKQNKRSVASRLLHAKDDRDKITAWKLDFIRILQVFNTELAIDTHTKVTDIHRNVLTGQEGTPGQHHSVQASIFLGESPPPAPRACFGREGLLEKVLGLAEKLEPISLIGAGGIGKTAIALSVLHNDRIKERFGENRRFIRCDQFPASRAHFLARLSKVIGAGVENPEDLAPLRPLLSSKEMLIILDNAESILDPQGTNAREIYSVVDELCKFKTVCVCITSRITTVPGYCKRPEIPALSMEAACDIFYGIYDNGRRSSIINDLLERLDFHALSITLLATTASHNMWDFDRLAEEWDIRRAQVLQTDHNESLAATIELSLDSPTFHKLGPNARSLLEVIAFFPQGVDEKNLDWLFPNIPDRKNIFDKFCVLSLTHRSNGFITMLAPMRDYIGLRDPRSSPLLDATKDRYFSRLSVDVYPDKPGFEEARWIISEDVNVEHLLDVLISIDTNSDEAWGACFHFMNHLFWHKPRETVLMAKIEGLPDDHRSKPGCMIFLSRLFARAGNHAERKRLLTHALKLERGRGNNSQVARALRELADANRLLHFYDEGMQQAKEASEIYKQLGNTSGRAICFIRLARLLLDIGQLDAAEDTAFRAIDLDSEEGRKYHACLARRVLGEVYQSKGDKEKAILHFGAALSIASPLNWRGQLFWIHHTLAELFRDEDEFKDANAHVERAKSHATEDPYRLGRAVEMQARIWDRQGRFEDAKSEALHALEIYEKLGAAKDAENCRDLLRRLSER
ncbi:hypothetical protein BJ322DRAFT_805152 [Thelephora terrestris]|uniref:NB-ARC domain-containing protein n=1 Tax=Thelephora terrestris TaxID=56493 RepID=A0A9P6L6Q1_9AGAM|nr:hypothetical protein BJ322DRAFT_805152 [Thelephora terrestris]